MATSTHALLVAYITRTAEQARQRAARLAKHAAVAATVAGIAAGCGVPDDVSAPPPKQVASDAPAVETELTAQSICIDPAALETDPGLSWDVQSAAMYWTAAGHMVAPATSGCSITVSMGDEELFAGLAPEVAALARQSVRTVYLRASRWEEIVRRDLSTGLLTHELGHLLGHKHSDDLTDVMAYDAGYGAGCVLPSARPE